MGGIYLHFEKIIVLCSTNYITENKYLNIKSSIYLIIYKFRYKMDNVAYKMIDKKERKVYVK